MTDIFGSTAKLFDAVLQMNVHFLSRICSVSNFLHCTMKFGGKLFKAMPVDLDQSSEKLRANDMVFICMHN